MIFKRADSSPGSSGSSRAAPTREHSLELPPWASVSRLLPQRQEGAYLEGSITIKINNKQAFLEGHQQPHLEDRSLIQPNRRASPSRKITPLRLLVLHKVASTLQTPAAYLVSQPTLKEVEYLEVWGRLHLPVQEEAYLAHLKLHQTLVKTSEDWGKITNKGN